MSLKKEIKASHVIEEIRLKTNKSKKKTQLAKLLKIIGVLLAKL